MMVYRNTYLRLKLCAVWGKVLSFKSVYVLLPYQIDTK